MDPHAFFNARVWSLASKGKTISEIAEQTSLDPQDVLQRMGFDAFNGYTVTRSELEEAGLDMSVASGYGIEVSYDDEDDDDDDDED